MTTTPLRPTKAAAGHRHRVKPQPKPRTPGDELLTVDQVLAELGEDGKPLARSTFFRWKATGKAPVTIKLPNGSLRVRRRDLEAWIDAHEERPVA
jgi:predicted DNA-binding transcriptional regulator AlpA